MQHPIWGIDVTSVALRGVRLALDADGVPRIVAWDALDFANDVENVASSARLAPMQRALALFARGKELRYSRVWVSLRGEAGFNRSARLPKATDNTIPAVLQQEAERNIPYALDEVYWDHRLADMTADGGVDATYYAVRRSIVDDRIRKYERAGLPIDGIQLRPIALHNFCAFEHLLDEGTVVIDCDYVGLHVLAHHQGRSWFRVVPAGGADHVARLRDEAGLSHHEAVRVAGGEVPADARQSAIATASARAIAAEAERVVRFFAAARPAFRVKRVVLFHSHRCVPPLAQLLRESLGVSVEEPHGFRYVRVDEDVVSAGLQENFAALARATGLALQGAGIADVSVRLFPQRPERDLGLRKRWWIAATLLLCATIVVETVRVRSAAQAVEERTAALRVPPVGVRERTEVLRAVDAEEPLRRTEALARVEAPRARPLDILRHVSAKAEAAGVSVAAFDAEEGLLGHVVLVAEGAKEEAHQRLAEALASLADGDGPVSAVRAGLCWEAREVVSRAPVVPSQGPLRVPLHHLAGSLELRTPKLP
jgi:Tfp pilus assembly PilM family ATPase